MLPPDRYVESGMVLMFVLALAPAAPVLAPFAVLYFIVCNPPSWVPTVYRLFKALIFKKVRDRIKFITPASNKEELDLLLRFMTKEQLPAVLGGGNEVPLGEWSYTSA